MEYVELSDFLRKRRELLQPEDVGLPRGRRRRTPGLRREEVAALAVMSTDYYSRLEGGRGPQPSAEMLTAIARALRLTLDERDHLFVLAGHGMPPRTTSGDHVNPGLLRIMDRLNDDTPAVVLNQLGESLAQTRAHVAFEGEQTGLEGFERSAVYRWFAHEDSRALYAEEGRANHSRVLTSGLRSAVAVSGERSKAAALAKALRGLSAEFAELWEAHEVGVRHTGMKRFLHPVVGELELYCQLLDDQAMQQTLLVFTASPGSESDERLRLLSVLGNQRLQPTES
jgi:transcriptional regulator with XRE-family HTH domain